MNKKSGEQVRSDWLMSFSLAANNPAQDARKFYFAKIKKLPPVPAPKGNLQNSAVRAAILSFKEIKRFKNF